MLYPIHPQKSISKQPSTKRVAVKIVLHKVKADYDAAEKQKNLTQRAQSFLNYAEKHIDVLQTREYLNALYMTCISLFDSQSLTSSQSTALLIMLNAIQESYSKPSDKDEIQQTIEHYADKHFKKWGRELPFHLHTSSSCTQHSPTTFNEEHPESSVRLKAMLENIQLLSKQIGKLHNHVRIHARNAQNAIRATHGEGHLREIEQFCSSTLRHSYKKVDKFGDNIANQGTEPAIYACADIASTTMQSILSANGEEQRHFCIIRPPGHHAGDTRHGNTMEGFCFINNVMIAANEALKRSKSVLIVDIDAHSGNGTASMIANLSDNMRKHIQLIDIFANDDTSFAKHINTTEYAAQPWYHRYPLASNFTLTTFQKALKGALEKVKKDESFKPDVIIISAGFDAHKADQRIVGGNLTDFDFGEIGMILHKFAENMGISLMAVTEGGYDLDALARSSLYFSLGINGLFCKRILQQETVYESLCAAAMTVAESSKPVPIGTKPKRR